MPFSIAEAFRLSGLRRTPQRYAVLEYLMRSMHATPDEIYRAINRADPRASRATVYNNLHALDARLNQLLNYIKSNFATESSEDCQCGSAASFQLSARGDAGEQRDGVLVSAELRPQGWKSLRPTKLER